VLRSFGKFYGLAGLRLGFALTGARLRADLAELAGPWAVSGPAIAAGRVALRDLDWQRATRERLEADSARLDIWAAEAGWTLFGGTTLFRTYETPDATEAQDRLASQRIWSRIFPYSTRWLRLGLPGDASGWDRLRAALS
jgi:cobalamin biosynthetic protein CobC